MEVFQMNLNENKLTPELELFSQQRGADLFGVADLTAARKSDFTKDHLLISQFPRAISIGMQLCDAIVDQHSPDEKQRESLYWHHVYNVVTLSLS